MKSPYLPLLKKQIKKLDVTDFDLEAWKVSAHLLLSSIFGKHDERTLIVRDLKIDYSSGTLRDSNPDYKPLETCKRKGREVLELCVDELELSVLDDLELKALIDAGQKEEILEYLRKKKKEELVDLVMKLLVK